MNTPNRFDYVAYDDDAMKNQASFKERFMNLEAEVDHRLISPRAKALIHTYLEIAYMWVGKAIRDDQIKRNGIAPLQEQRGAE